MAVINCQIGCCIETFCSIQSSCVFEPPHTLAAVGGCYVGSASPPPRRARYGSYGVHESLSFLFPGRVSAPSHPLDGRETAIPPAERARSALRCRRGMQFPRRTRTARPQARARRAARRRCADPSALRRQESKLHSEAADASEASGQAEVCGPACLTEPGQRFRQNGIAPGRCEFSRERITPHGCIYGIVL